MQPANHNWTGLQQRQFLLQTKTRWLLAAVKPNGPLKSRKQAATVHLSGCRGSRDIGTATSVLKCTCCMQPAVRGACPMMNTAASTAVDSGCSSICPSGMVTLGR